MSRNPPVVFALTLESAFAHAPTAALLLDDEETRHIIIHAEGGEEVNDNDNGIISRFTMKTNRMIYMLGC